MSDRPTISIYFRGHLADIGYYKNWDARSLFFETLAIASVYEGCNTVEGYRAKRYGTQNVNYELGSDIIPNEEKELKELESYSELPLIVDMTQKYIYCNYGVMDILELKKTRKEFAAVNDVSWNYSMLGDSYISFTQLDLSKIKKKILDWDYTEYFLSVSTHDVIRGISAKNEESQESTEYIRPFEEVHKDNREQKRLDIFTNFMKDLFEDINRDIIEDDFDMDEDYDIDDFAEMEPFDLEDVESEINIGCEEPDMSDAGYDNGEKEEQLENNEDVEREDEAFIIFIRDIFDHCKYEADEFADINNEKALPTTAEEVAYMRNELKKNYDLYMSYKNSLWDMLNTYYHTDESKTQISDYIKMRFAKMYSKEVAKRMPVDLQGEFIELFNGNEAVIDDILNREEIRKYDEKGIIDRLDQSGRNSYAQIYWRKCYFPEIYTIDEQVWCSIVDELMDRIEKGESIIPDSCVLANEENS